MLRLFHRLMDIGWVYRLAQLLGRATVRRYDLLVRKHVSLGDDRRVLEIGCGVGSSRPLFGDDYTGIDINADYIRIARQTLSGEFHVMDAARMSFEPNSFDDAVSIATGHHLNDGQLASMIRTATTVASTLHIIDAILPVSPHACFKTAWFRADRGRHVRRFEQLRQVVARNAQVEADDILKGPLHDVCYIRASCLEPRSRTAGGAVDAG